ncbi:MAG: 50S ribosomal protein L27 [Candidatus Yanofskybacteria bacterium]|nr:50S ribosomal protein L27 [Candidatus Yanofskybacteria bacterium]
MAHTKASGTTQLGRDSQPQYLGIKLHDGQVAKIGNIIIRQRGSKYHIGTGVRLGSDYTIYAIVNGKVKYTTRRKTNYHGKRTQINVVSVLPN